jgi:16S rRNA C967 or C1407 C5-methylase (RsmB/RsmF family)/NOL1/NOP2/fmu family ribosome biogenesis protein
MKLPEAFIQNSATLPGMDIPAFINALENSSPVSIRLNHKNNYHPEHENRVPWCENAFYLDERPSFTADPEFHAGNYYVQEASSMFLQFIAENYLKNCNKVLDLCAAPGGKSTLLCNILPEDCLLVSNEIIRSRAMILAENIIKWGNDNVVVTNNTPEDFAKLPGFFDAIVVDAPCSGEGMFRKDHGAIEEWSEYNVTQCASRQQDILEQADICLKEDGYLIYSTCTFNREENEKNVLWFAENFDYEIITPDISTYKDIIQTEAGMRFYPDKIKGEGFFISILRKKNREVQHFGTNYVKKVKPLKPVILNNKVLKNQENYFITDNGQQIIAYKHPLKNEMLLLNEVLNTIVCGISLYIRKGKDLIPEHQLALSKAILVDEIETATLNRQDAICYLKRENIVLPDHSKSYILVKYNNSPLGWVKNLGNRCNNLYPAHWRIRMNIG